MTLWAHWDERSWYWLGGGLWLAAFVLRLIALPVVTDDFTYFLDPWFQALATNPGLSAFAEPFSNYAPLYLYLLKILTWLPGESLYLIKGLSILADLGIALIGFKLVGILRPAWSRARRFLAAVFFFALPTVLVNGALWGQSDSLYALFVLTSFYFLLRSRPLSAALAFGLAFSFKLQAVFWLPVLLGVYWHEHWPWRYLLWIPGVYVLTLIPAAFAGGDFGDLLFTYFRQAGEYQALTLGAPTWFAFVPTDQFGLTGQSALAAAGVALAAIAALGIVWLLKKWPSKLGPRALVSVSLLAALLIPFLLPRMHERYFFLADLFALLYALVFPRRSGVAAGVIGVSFFAYAFYLGQFTSLFAPLAALDLRLLAALEFGLIVFVAYWLFRFRRGISRSRGG